VRLADHVSRQAGIDFRSHCPATGQHCAVDELRGNEQGSIVLARPNEARVFDAPIRAPVRLPENVALQLLVINLYVYCFSATSMPLPRWTAQ
jgi:hypothetical protein